MITNRSLTRILMVEDEPDIQVIARLALEVVGGFHVETCGSGEEALVTAPAFVPDLILLDVMMPGMDGPSTLKALRELPSIAATPIIFMTATVQPQEVARYKDLGALDVIPKPFDPSSLASTLSAIWNDYQAHTPYAAEEQLNDLRNTYLLGLDKKIAQIEGSWNGLMPGPWDAEEVKTLHRLVHGLAGSSATFSFPAISERAHTMELLLKPFIERSGPPIKEQRAEISESLGALKQACAEFDLSASPDQRSPIARLSAPAQATARPPTASVGDYQSPVTAEEENRLIFLVADEPDLAQDLTLQIGYFGYIVRTLVGIPSLAEACLQSPPAAILIDSVFLEGDGAEILGEMQRSYEKALPVIFFSVHDDLTTRLQAARAGGEAYFTRPINIGGLIDKLDLLTAHPVQEPYRIVIVDDEPLLAELYALTLQGAKMLTATVTNPLEVMRVLAEFMPDLILMDMYMPHCSGLDLAKVIRQQGAYVSTPIVFLSTETSVDMQLEAMQVGGDDFLTKPIIPDRLISAVTSRVERAHILRSFMVRDSLTGLLKHTVIKERLEIEMARAQRHHAQLVFAMIDIDHFKSVNDTYGHATGDRVIQSLSRLLQQRLRKTDVIGRYGGEEFAVILADTNGPSALKVLDQLRIGFGRIRHQSGGATFYTTFSCGIAEYPRYADAVRLNAAGDRALYKAKHAGRNRVMLASDIGF